MGVRCIAVLAVVATLIASGLAVDNIADAAAAHANPPAFPVGGEGATGPQGGGVVAAGDGPAAGAPKPAVDAVQPAADAPQPAAEVPKPAADALKVAPQPAADAPKDAPLPAADAPKDAPKPAADPGADAPKPPVGGATKPEDDDELKMTTKTARRFPRVRLRQHEWTKLGKKHVWANKIMEMLENAAKEMVPSHMLTFDIKAGDFELFHFDTTELDVERNATAQGDIFVVSGLDDTVEFKIRDPMNEYVYAHEKTFEAHFRVPITKAGQYTIMVRTQAHQARRVALSYSITHNDKPTHGHAGAEDVQRMWESVGFVTRGVAEVEKMQEHMELRTRANLATQRSTNARVLRFTMVEMIVMLLVMVVQVLVIRNFKYRTPGAQWRV